MNMRKVWAIASLIGAVAWLATSHAFAANNARTSAQPINSATANAALIADLFQNESVATFYVSGLTASGATLTVEGSSDGRNDNDPLKAWFAINAIPMTCPATPFTTLTADQGLRIDASGLTNVRVRVSSTGTGNILVSYNAIPGAASTIGACGSLPVTGTGSGGAVTVAGNVGGFNIVVSDTPTVTASSYTANNAIGGLQTVGLFRTTTQPSGVFDYAGIASKSGVTSGIAIYGFLKSPTSTCTDHAAFVLASADLPYLIPGFPITLTPAATVGTTQTTASQALPVSINNQDTSATVNAYFCAVAVGTPSPASTSDLVFSYGIVRD